MRSKIQEGKDWWTMNLKSKTGSEKQLRGLGYLVRQSRSQVSGGTGPRMEEGVEFGWRQVKFPCPAGPWGVLVADVTSGAWKLPSSLAAISFPSGPPSISACPGLSADHLLKRGSFSSITLPFFYKKQTQWAHHWHLTETTVYTHVLKSSKKTILQSVPYLCNV